MTIDQAALVVGALAAEVVARAVVRAVTTATGLPRLPVGLRPRALNPARRLECGKAVGKWRRRCGRPSDRLRKTGVEPWKSRRFRWKNGAPAADRLWQEPVENRRATVDALWKPCGREGVSGRGRERVRRASDVVLVGGVVASSVAIACAALLAWAAGSLGPAVGAVSLLAGVVAGALAARSALRVPLDPPKGGAGVLGRARPRRLRRRLHPSVRVARVRAGRRPPDARSRTTTATCRCTGPTSSTSPAAPRSGRRTRSSPASGCGTRFGVDLLTAVFVQLGASLPVRPRGDGTARGGPRRPRPAALGRGARRRGVRLRRAASPASSCSGPGASRTTSRPSTGRTCSWRSSCRSAGSCSRCPRASFSSGPGVGACCGARRGSRPGSRGVLWGALPLVHLHTFLFVSLLGGGVGDRRRARARGSPDPGLGPRPRHLVASSR